MNFLVNTMLLRCTLVLIYVHLSFGLIVDKQVTPDSLINKFYTRFEGTPTCVLYRHRQSLGSMLEVLLRLVAGLATTRLPLSCMSVMNWTTVRG